MNGARFVVETLQRHGVDTIFGYPGGAIMPFYDALVDSALSHILCRHEQAAAFAANGYARASGKLGVCVATSGPGATNLITGIADAYMDSVPMLAITGQVSSAFIGTDAFQETDILGLSFGITKHSYLVRNVAELPEILEEAIHLAQEGRPGPVLIDIPKDVQLAACSEVNAMPIDSDAHVHALRDADLKNARDLLAQSERPIIYAGGGITLGGAIDVFRVFQQSTGIPVVSTLKGLGALPAAHPDHLGMLGMHGAPCANIAVHESDLLIVVGARFDDRATGKLSGFAPDAKIIHLDLDPAEVDKLRRADVSLLGNLSQSLSELHQTLAIDAWRERCRILRAQQNFTLPPQHDLIAPQTFLRVLSQRAQENTYISCDVGQHQMWVAQYYGFSHPRQHLSSGGLGAMGFGLPAAIGAFRSHPSATVINIAGDGSFMMNMQELATIRRYALPIKIVIFDNQYLGMVRQQQELFYEGRYSEVDLSDNPDFVAVAQAFGIPAIRVDETNDVNAIVDTCLNTPGPLLIHFPIQREHNVWPIVEPGTSNHQMIKENRA